MVFASIFPPHEMNKSFGLINACRSSEPVSAAVNFGWKAGARSLRVV